MPDERETAGSGDKVMVSGPFRESEPALILSLDTKFQVLSLIGLAILPYSTGLHKWNGTADLPAGAHRVLQQVPQQGADLRLIDRKAFRDIQAYIIVDPIFPRFPRKVCADGVEREIGGKGPVDAGGELSLIRLQILFQSVYVVPLQIGLHDAQMLAQIVADCFHLLHVLCELLVLCFLEIQKLPLHFRLFHKGRLAADAVQRVQQDGVNQEYAQQQKHRANRNRKERTCST